MRKDKRPIQFRDLGPGVQALKTRFGIAFDIIVVDGLTAGPAEKQPHEIYQLVDAGGGFPQKVIMTTSMQLPKVGCQFLLLHNGGEHSFPVWDEDEYPQLWRDDPAFSTYFYIAGCSMRYMSLCFAKGPSGAAEVVEEINRNLQRINKMEDLTPGGSVGSVSQAAINHLLVGKNQLVSHFVLRRVKCE